MKRLALITCLLAGCTSLPADPSKMSPEQLKEWARDKNANVACTSGKTAAGNVVATYVVLDKGVLGAGGASVTVDNECKVTIGGAK
jgi:starvation-inducible outer membrane lipoprotein